MHLKQQKLRIIKGGSSPLSSISAQAPLFLADSAIAFVAMQGMTDKRFAYLLNLRPVKIVDCRSAPRFDYGSLDRRSVFNLFEGLRIQYTDIGSPLSGPETAGLGITSPVVASLGRIKEDMLRGGPAMLLCEDTASAEAMSKLLPALLKPTPAGGWQVAVL